MVEQSLPPTALVIFSSSEIGAGAMLNAQKMALDLPRRILVFEEASGQIWASYREPATVATGHGLAVDHPAVLAIRYVLQRFWRLRTVNRRQAMLLSLCPSDLFVQRKASLAGIEV